MVLTLYFIFYILVRVGSDYLVFHFQNPFLLKGINNDYFFCVQIYLISIDFFVCLDSLLRYQSLFTPPRSKFATHSLTKNEILKFNFLLKKKEIGAAVLFLCGE